MIATRAKIASDPTFDAKWGRRFKADRHPDQRAVHPWPQWGLCSVTEFGLQCRARLRIDEGGCGRSDSRRPADACRPCVEHRFAGIETGVGCDRHLNRRTRWPPLCPSHPEVVARRSGSRAAARGSGESAPYVDGFILNRDGAQHLGFCRVTPLEADAFGAAEKLAGADIDDGDQRQEDADRERAAGKTMRQMTKMNARTE